MINKIYNLLKKTVAAFFLLYSYNMLVPSSIIIPINALTLITLILLNIKGLIILIILKVLL